MPTMSVAANRVIRARKDMTDPSIQTKNAGINVSHIADPRLATQNIIIATTANRIDRRTGTVMIPCGSRNRPVRVVIERHDLTDSGSACGGGVAGQRGGVREAQRLGRSVRIAARQGTTLTEGNVPVEMLITSA